MAEVPEVQTGRREAGGSGGAAGGQLPRGTQSPRLAECGREQNVRGCGSSSDCTSAVLLS